MKRSTLFYLGALSLVATLVSCECDEVPEKQADKARPETGVPQGSNDSLLFSTSAR